jgi:hypothetical protein
MNIQDEIDASFGTGPAQGTVHAILADGHRALRRRRLATSGAAALVAVVLGGSAVFATGGGGDRSGGTGDVAVSPSATGSPEPRHPERPTRKEMERALGMGLADYRDDGRFTVDPRARDVQRLNNPYDLVAPERSTAVAVEFRGAVYWFVAYRYADESGGGSSIWSGASDQSFVDWVHSEEMLDGRTESPGPDGWPGVPDLVVVRFAGTGDGEVLEPINGAMILQQRPSPQVGDAFATAADRSAVARVRAADGTLYYVLARETDGVDPEYIGVTAKDGGPSLDAFLDFARERYAGDGGGLL